MRMIRAFFMAIVIIGPTLAVSAATLTASGSSRDTLVRQNSLDGLSVGADYDQIERQIEPKTAAKPNTKLDARAISGFMGYDIFNWLTVFATAGGSQAKFDQDDNYDGAGFKWSGGLNLNLWHYNLEDPSFMAGRASFRAIGEFSQYRSAEGDDSFRWNDIFGSILFNYEIFVVSMKDLDRYPYSIAFYIGPALSKINGTHENAVTSFDFNESNIFGVVGGVDLYVAHNLAIGGQILYFDGTTLEASLRYAF